MKITLNIPPPKGTAQQQKTVARGRFISKYDPPNVKKMKRIFTSELIPHTPEEPLEGALSLEVLFAYPYRKADIKKAQGRELWKNTQPDCDNLVKGLNDIMEKLGFYSNDGQIASLSIEKVWSAEPRIEINLEEMKPYVE
jgi:Holliday junction resolvase RusA-like endonuclease